MCCKLKRNDESCEEVEGVLKVREGEERKGRKTKNVLLKKDDHALWFSSCVRRKPGEWHLLALLKMIGERERGEKKNRSGVGGAV